MQSIRTFFYCLKQGLRSIFHNGMFSLASIGTIAASLFLLGLFFFVTSNVSYVMKEAEQNVGVTVLFVEDCPEDTIKKIGEEIDKLVHLIGVFIECHQGFFNAHQMMALLKQTRGNEAGLEGLFTVHSRVHTLTDIP